MIDKMNCYREHVFLFLPFRSEFEEVESADCEKKFYVNFEQIKSVISNYCKFGSNDLDRRIFDVENGNYGNYESDSDAEGTEYSIPKTKIDVDIFEQMGIKTKTQNQNKAHVTRFVNPKIITNEQVFSIIDSLNAEQRKIVMHILHSFKTNQLPIRVFMSGSAGVGKSRVINTVYQLISIYSNEIPGENSDDTKILLCAPSGEAAFLIGGVTCHRAFGLPVSKYCKQMSELSEDISNKIRKSFSHLELIIIDEISMVGSVFFFK